MSDLHQDGHAGADTGSEFKAEAIAIVGASGRFPRAKNLAEFWQRLRAGEELVTFFSDEELLAAGVAPDLLHNPHYVKARAVLSDAELFDASFFGINPREAEVLDPQQRIFLETAWEALEDAGYDPQRYAGAIGVYGGLSMNSYLFNNLLSRPDITAQVGGYQLMLASDKDFLTTRTSYKLNLRGPSVNVQTACSTSLVAVQMACQSLLTYQCDIALAGGVSIVSPRACGYLYQPGMIMSPDGHCRPFDARGQGIVAGEGAGIVVLKRLSEALADGDTIRAVIIGSAINNDGADKVGFTAPSVQGQSEAITMAQAMAGVEPGTIQYIEAHGTGTELGDPIEIAALTQAFRLGTEQRNFCAIGSVKSNMGHLDAAAGIAGLLKTMLALEHRQIPPTLHVEQPNPNIDFAGSPFYIATRLADWPSQATPRRAGVSSFGIGGTNAHVVLEEAPPLTACSSVRRYHLLPLSALTPTALDKATANLAAHLAANDSPARVNDPASTSAGSYLADVAFTLQTGRKMFNQRRFVVCAGVEEAVSRLQGHPQQPLPSSAQGAHVQRVAFLFPGQGAQYAGMGRDLYATEAVFRATIDQCAELLREQIGLDLRTLLYPTPETAEEASRSLRQTAYTQPALFAIEYALAQLWMSWGIQPQAMLGHSIGEYVAACVAGVFSLADALSLVAERGRLMQTLPSGSMLAVPLAESELLPYLHSGNGGGNGGGNEGVAGLDLAAVNAPRMCVVAGPAPAIDLLQARLTSAGVQCQPLHTSHAFHSSMMDPILETFSARVAAVKLHPPALPYLSNVTGSWITAEQATDPAYWVRHLRSPVRFAQGVGELLRSGSILLLESGPGHSLGSLVKQHTLYSSAAILLPSLRHPHDSTPDDQLVAQTLGRLWLAGAPIDWVAYNSGEPRRRVPLPPYAFDRSRYWVEAMPAQQASPPAPSVLRKRSELSSWFYAPSWKKADLPPVAVSAASLAAGVRAGNWLLFADECNLAAQLAERLQGLGHTVNIVLQGASYLPLEAGVCTLPVADAAAYQSLFDDLRRTGQFPSRIVHLWNVTRYDGIEESPAASLAAQNAAFYSLMYIAQALGQYSNSNQLQIDVVATGLYDVIGNEPLTPAKATLLGPCLVIAQEQPYIECRAIDIVLPEDVKAGAIGSTTGNVVETQLWAELQRSADMPQVALRGRHRWTPVYEQVALPPVQVTPPVLRAQGVYLITGGLGGIGLALSELLAQQVQARLVLTARTALPPRSQWAAWLAEHGEDDLISRRLVAVQALEALGSEVLTLQADATDLGQMQAAVDAARARFGPIHGAIHAAGVAGGGVIPFMTRAGAERVFAPKVLGTIVLDTVFKDEPLDFVMLCSSFNALLGMPGQMDYSAANAWLDAFARAKAQAGGPPTIAINWATWQEVGMAQGAEVPLAMQEARRQSLLQGLRTKEGQDAFARILTYPLPQYVVSPVDFYALLASAEPMRNLTDWSEAQTPASSDLASSAQASSVLSSSFDAVHLNGGDGSAAYARPALATAYVAPRNALEEQVAGIWQQLFGIDGLGIHDNFYELGGHSLLATQILVRLQDSFGVELPARTIFESHTIADLARQIEMLLWMEQSRRDQTEGPGEDREELEF